MQEIPLEKLVEGNKYTPIYEPIPRRGHCGVAYNEQLYVWGGLGNMPGIIPASIVDVFDYRTGLWEQRRTNPPNENSPPRGVIYSAYALLDSRVYMYGGWNGTVRFDSFHYLDLSNLEWGEVKPVNRVDGPLKKSNAKMEVYGDQLVLFGGYLDSSEYTNELHTYSTTNNLWARPPMTGSVPGGRAWFSFTRIDVRTAVVFGGYVEGHKAVNDIYVLNMDEWFWSELKVVLSGPWGGRADHSATCIGGPLLGGTEPPQLFVVGGVSSKGKPMEDAWILDMADERWRMVDLPKRMGPRHSHSATIVSGGTGSKMLFIFGLLGRKQKWDGKSVIPSSLIFEIGVRSLFQHCIIHIAQHYDYYKPLLHLVPPPLRQTVKDYIIRQENMKYFPVIDVFDFVQGISSPFYRD